MKFRINILSFIMFIFNIVIYLTINIYICNQNKHYINTILKRENKIGDSRAKYIAESVKKLKNL